MAKEGSTIAGLMESFGTVVSVALQHGVPLQVLVGKLSHTRFEPSGWTGNEQLGYAKSIMDYLITFSAGSNCASCRERSCRCLPQQRRRVRTPARRQTRRLAPASRMRMR
jgi:hypothetical protein